MLLQDAIRAAGTDPGQLFGYLYNSMDSVASFGRTARFDYLTMLGKLRLAAISPASPFLDGSSGPLRGSKLLFLGNATATGLPVRDLDALVVQLGAALGVGMQEMEDSLCNWQKSPAVFRAYRG
jgi:hypothetical protein